MISRYKILILVNLTKRDCGVTLFLANLTEERDFAVTLLFGKYTKEACDFGVTIVLANLTKNWLFPSTYLSFRQILQKSEYGMSFYLENLTKN